MGNIFSFPQSAAQLAWSRYATLARQLRTNPNLIEDPAHLAARKEAHRRFCELFEGAGK